MRALVVVALLAACTATPPPASPLPSADLVLTTTVANGKVGRDDQDGLRPRPAGARDRRAAPNERFAPRAGRSVHPASGFHGTATVRRLTVTPVTASPPSPASVEVTWDLKDEAGQAVVADDYSLVFLVVDNAGVSTTVGATLQVR